MDLECVCLCFCPSSLRRWPLFLLIGFTDPYNHTYSESLWWKLFKKHQRTQIQRQRQWQRQRQRHRKSAWNTQLMLYFWNPDDLLIPNMMIDTSPWSSCSHRSPWFLCSSLNFSSTGPSVSPFRDFLLAYHILILSALDLQTNLSKYIYDVFKTTWKGDS